MYKFLDAYDLPKLYHDEVSAVNIAVRSKIIIIIIIDPAVKKKNLQAKKMSIQVDSLLLPDL